MKIKTILSLFFLVVMVTSGNANEGGPVDISHGINRVVEVLRQAPKKKEFISPQFKTEEQVFKENGSRMGLSFRFSGGFGYVKIGDWNTYLTGWTANYEHSADLNGRTLDGELKNIHWSPQFFGEVVIHFSKRLGLSLGAGYGQTQHSREGTIMTVYDVADTMISSRSHRSQVRAVPIRAGLYFFVPFSEKIRVFINGGVGYYLTFFDDKVRFDYADGSWFERTHDAESQGFGFHGGLGLEFDVSRQIAFFVQAEGRYAKIDGYEGDLDWKSSTGTSGNTQGKVYYYERLQTLWDPWVFISSIPPEGGNYRNIREAKFDFSGISLILGLRIRL